MKHMGITVDGLDGLLLSLEEIMDLPDAVAREMLEAEAEIVEEAQRRTGEAMGVHRTGATLDAIGHTGMKRGPDGTRSLSVSLRGTNAKGVRNKSSPSLHLSICQSSLELSSKAHLVASLPRGDPNSLSKVAITGEPLHP